MAHPQTLDLIKDLVIRLTSNHSTPPDGPHTEKALKYAVRILTSRMTPSISPDESAVAESIKRRLVTDGKSSDALTFADLYSKFSSRSGPGCVANRWAVLYLLKVISEDQRQSDGKASSFASAALSGGLPVLSNSSSSHDSSKNQNGGVFVISKDPEGIREIALREFSDLVRGESEVSEGVLVRDVLYACQGIDGKYVKFDERLDGYNLPESIKVPRSTRIMVRKLCELGWLFRKVKGYISESMDRFPAEEVGTVGQAFCAALQDELSDYYKLLAVLESQSLNPIPLASEGNSGNYISLRRLAVWFAEPMVRMRLMAVLVDGCKVLRGGAMAGAIHGHAQHGDPMVQDFMRRLLRRVCSPLFEMVRSWVLEGELEDIFVEFFIVSEPVKAESLWREGYRLHDGMLPAFITPSLAKRILRTGKSINFLRVCCDDQGWADGTSEAAAAAGTTTMRGGLGYGETDALETLVVEAAKRIDKHLMDVMYKRYKFKEHCLAIKRYLLLGQGDFVQYLMDIVGPELSEPANTISSFKLAGLLESAIRSSNAQYDDPDILDRLRVKMMPHDAGDRGWDVFSLEYNASVPLDTVFTESVMARYLRIFNFLWKLRRVEHALIGAWKTMKPNCISSDLFAEQGGGVMLHLVSVSRRCQVLWNEMNHFVTNLQYYIMFEVLEVSWSYFVDEMEVAKDLDDLLVAHEKYLNSIVEKSLLGERSQHICKALFVLFDLILRFRSYADRLYEGISELQSSLRKSGPKGRRKSNLKQSREQSKLGAGVGEGRKAKMQYALEFRRKMGEDLDTIANEYLSSLKGFISQLPVQQHVDLKFLMFRLDFTEFYSRLPATT
ncbi:gamma-tubulin complex component 3 [Magnolia sinica]|uniref:gamma-tubulin complex component 3 n=1 Tax=Magnolia sinica TaxID=86752 RepID=UPI0026591869|nr:gamma-tubulin complex component 3 [Magnolia sinica]XP_058078358.1 gamma-tubulin complex component 3 [Magnolia sinica]XP_058078359.1 gamma-tubulin complex component 3 [Magnolia sinica]XP_058078360.1 gamma-tubulin complex component 3 [Magnolia sinica]XP_058078361.1 gamma-tubulin complex component 3 [Magnolia sinica]XP_058078362.1 gamma-tubulin complex component 3 [Magnolia sinica]XP_058078363.1 gamma-tubulin complex component 3 [Magnolia sinica]XP_058078364.1 gamma-tubulin complex component